MGALVNALRGSEHETGLDPALLLPLDLYWEQVIRVEGFVFSSISHYSTTTIRPAAAAAQPPLGAGDQG